VDFLSPKWESSTGENAGRFLGGNTRCSLKIELCDKLEPLKDHSVSWMIFESFKIK
jgi:hypothetical protein